MALPDYRTRWVISLHRGDVARYYIEGWADAAFLPEAEDSLPPGLRFGEYAIVDNAGIAAWPPAT